MSINPKYILASGLDEYFVDQTTGLPLSEGTLTFWSDVNRSTPKDVYTISGSPPNYTYVNLGSTITLNSTGNPADESGNNIVIYYYPYDDEGNVELYYVECHNSDDALQFTREAWPNTFVEEIVDQQTENIPNFISNGQFRLHNNIPANPSSGLLAGRITQDITNIAPGNWYIHIPSHALSTDYITFFTFGEYVTNPTASPRFAAQFQCLGANPAVPYKDFYVQFSDVNKFSSDTQQYTFSFTGITFESADITVGLFIEKNYGTGGSPSPVADIFLTNFTITSAETLFQHTFVFGANTGTQVGTNNDDNIKVYLRFPSNVSFGVQLTDFVLVEGPIDITTFPQTTDEDFVARSMIPPIPDPNGNDLYLPIISAPNGYIYDHSSIGNIVQTISPTASVSYLSCDGSAYQSAQYSSDGIPYRRLQTKLMAAANCELPLFGTGLNYVSATSVNGAPTTSFILTTNKPGTQTAVSDGTVATGFTFHAIHPGSADIELNSFVYGPGDRIWIYNELAGYPVQLNSAGTSPFTINSVPQSAQGEVPGTPVAHQLVSVIFPSLPSAGQYFETASPNSGYYIWYKVNGSGSDPAVPGYLGIEVDIYSGMNVYDLAYVTACAINSFQAYEIITVAGSSITPNSYFNFYANGTHYYVWMSLNGAGTDPAIASAVGIPVTYQSTYSAAQIKTAIVSAINDLYFAVPDFRGITLKGWDPTGNIDLNSAYRYSMNRYQGSPISLPHYIGSKQFGVLLSHQHNVLRYHAGAGEKISPANTADHASPDTQVDISLRYLIEPSGTAQNDVENAYINYLIKY